MIRHPELRYPTPNQTPGNSGRTHIFIHSTRSGQDWPPLNDWGATINWFGLAHAQASSHLLIGVNVARFVEDGNTAWHAKEHSASSLSIEIVQPRTDTPFIPASLDLTAWACAVWCINHGIPAERVMSTVGTRGIIGHEDSEQGRRDGKSDPGPLFPWPAFIKRTQALVLLGVLEPNIAKGDYLKVLAQLRYIGTPI